MMRRVRAMRRCRAYQRRRSIVLAIAATAIALNACGSSGSSGCVHVVEAVVSELATPSELDHTVRVTPGGRHVSLTLEMTVQSAEQVRSIYARIREVKGLTLLF